MLIANFISAEINSESLFHAEVDSLNNIKSIYVLYIIPFIQTELFYHHLLMHYFSCQEEWTIFCDVF